MLRERLPGLRLGRVLVRAGVVGWAGRDGDQWIDELTDEVLTTRLDSTPIHKSREKLQAYNERQEALAAAKLKGEGKEEEEDGEGQAAGGQRRPP